MPGAQALMSMHQAAKICTRGTPLINCCATTQKIVKKKFKKQNILTVGKEGAIRLVIGGLSQEHALEDDLRQQYDGAYYGGHDEVPPRVT